MRFAIASTILAAISFAGTVCLASPPEKLIPWAMPWGPEIPGAMSASSLLDKPAAKDGPIVARDGHFYSGAKRVNINVIGSEAQSLTSEFAVGTSGS